MREIKLEAEDKFPPKELIAKCYAVINSSRITNLPEVIVTKDNMVTLGLLPDMVVIMGGATAAFKIRIMCWISAAIAVVCAWVFSWWILVVALVAIVIERKIAARSEETWKFLAAVLLSLEVLANDFAGWGTARPDAMRRAIVVMGYKRQAWLDYILPRRNEINKEELMQKFGPA